MGDFRDQLKKIKNALVLGESDKRDVAKKTSIDKKSIPVTLKNSRIGSLPTSLLKSVPEHKRPPTSSRLPQTFQNKSKITAPKNLSEISNRKKSDKLFENSSGVIITRTYTSDEKLKSTSQQKAVIQSALPPNISQPGNLILPSFTALTRTSEFKIPDSWVARGASTQLSLQTTGYRREIFIGLDFGTAFTKVAVQFLDNIYPVDWDGVANLKERYLLPTEYSEIPNFECFLGQHPKSTPNGLNANLKRAFIKNNISDVSMAKAGVFLALVLQYVRAWIYHKHSEKLGTGPIGWYLNIGIPSDVLDKDKHAYHYRKLANIAWELSKKPNSEIKYKQAYELLSNPIKQSLDLREIMPIPELVAQLAGYSKSANKQKGLHALVDIGGGTADMVTFNVHEASGDDVFPFFVSNVKALGSYAFLEHRFNKFPIEEKVLGSDIQSILTAEAFSKSFGIPVHLIKEVDKQFFAKFQHEFEFVLGTTHKRRYPSSPNWKTGIRTFIAGGGAFIQGYPESIRTSHRPNNCPLIAMELPPHPKVVNLEMHRTNYSRISVACGLTFDSDSLGTIRPASEVDDATPLISTVNGLPRRERPDRDELYPK